MKLDDLKKIIDENDHSWIKVKSYEEAGYPEDIGYQRLYDDLMEHHNRESEFLISKCRELASLLEDHMMRHGDDEI